MFQSFTSPSSKDSAPAATLVQDKHSDMILEEGHRNSAELLAISKQQQARDTDVAITRFEQVRFRLARLGKSRSLHEVFERSRHFYFPQRLWIAFSVSNVGIVFILAVYMFGVKAACSALIVFRIQIMTLLVFAVWEAVWATVRWCRKP